MGLRLKPCPFCGGNDIRKVTTLSYSEIWCYDCHAGITRGLALGKYDSIDEAEEDCGVEAEEAWNRRYVSTEEVDFDYAAEDGNG